MALRLYADVLFIVFYSHNVLLSQTLHLPSASADVGYLCKRSHRAPSVCMVSGIREQKLLNYLY